MSHTHTHTHTHTQVNPFEVGLGWQVNLSKDTFIGKPALERIREQGVSHKLAGLRVGGRRVGVFSTRSPHRPNPVGLTLLRLEGVDLKRGVLHVSGLDLVNGTPIIDIKPYMPRKMRRVGLPPHSMDRRPHVVCPVQRTTPSLTPPAQTG